MMNKFNPFHLVEMSPWPLLTSNIIMCFVVSMLLMLNKKSILIMLTTIILTTMMSYVWWRDIHRESSNQGNHSDMVMNGLKTGMILFITSEIFFFISFFWSFFHSSVSPVLELGQSWPPTSIVSFNPMSIPLMNTILLLSSGVTVTIAHHEMLKKNFSKAKISLFLTVLMGVLFSILQAFEYMEAPFSMTDSSFGSSFFMATGFHGLHVLIGSLFLIVTMLRINQMVNNHSHMIGFECAAWYWHFVDVVWLFLYSMLYWWGA